MPENTLLYIITDNLVIDGDWGNKSIASTEPTILILEPLLFWPREAVTVPFCTSPLDGSFDEFPVHCTRFLPFVDLWWGKRNNYVKEIVQGSFFPGHFVSNDVKIRVPKRSGCVRGDSPPCTQSRDNHRRWRQINTLCHKSGSIWGRTYKKKGIRGSTCASREWNPKLNLRLKSLPFRWVATAILRFCWTLQLHAATDAVGPHNHRWDDKTCAVKSDPQGEWDAQCNFDSLNQRETISRNT